MRYEISDELREWAARHTPVKLGTQLACGPVEQIIAIADRIDHTCERDEIGFGSGRAYCMDCRYPLEPEYKYCPNCGARLVDEDAD